MDGWRTWPAMQRDTNSDGVGPTAEGGALVVLGSAGRVREHRVRVDDLLDRRVCSRFIRGAPVRVARPHLRTVGVPDLLLSCPSGHIQHDVRVGLVDSHRRRKTFFVVVQRRLGAGDRDTMVASPGPRTDTPSRRGRRAGCVGRCCTNAAQARVLNAVLYVGWLPTSIRSYVGVLVRPSLLGQRRGRALTDPVTKFGTW